ncbi:protein LYRIC-like isoform X4 [Stegostoma tigrinum]|uniref:protein LYRIC-like isoform X4 n=1 Tax=Stegostoma tigrinum TaxID=3053191 RepID=UPI00287062DB|nr:protein LYRIC-like isoform X4 [Stegostoma tigrinum]
MAASWHAVLADQAELLVGRLEDGVWAGLGLLRRGLGIDLGLEPWLRRQPPGSAGLALLVLLLLVVVPAALWALGRLLVSAFKKPGPAQAQAHGRFQHGHRGRRSGSGGGARNWDKTPADIQQQRLEEQRRKNKRKEKPKKLQPNGRAGTEPLDEEILHPFEKLIVRQHLDTEKKTEKTKKNKKKPKADMKQLQEEPQNWAEGKETDEGAWETKISSREKRQQRRRDKGINESPSVDSSLPAVGSEAVPAQQHTVASAGLGPRKTKGVETAGTSSEPASQSSTTDHHWDANPAASPVDDAWSGINGIATADPSSDWNAPTEEWGNWLVEESTSAAQPEDVVAETPKLSDEDKEKVDLGLQGSATSKAKKKKKKKKKCEDAAAAPVQETEEQEKESISGDQEQFIVQDQPEKEIGPPVETICTSEPAEVEEAQMVEIAEEPAVIMESSSQDITSQVPDTLSETELPVSAAKQNNLPPSQAKSDENWESPKQIKKKKRARRET